MRHNTTILSLIAVLFLGGCSLSPQLNVPSVELPSKSVEALHVELSWWTKFGDAKLNALIEEALSNNDDLKLSTLRILKAKQAYGLSDANRYPGSSRISPQETHKNKPQAKHKKNIFFK